MKSARILVLASKSKDTNVVCDVAQLKNISVKSGVFYTGNRMLELEQFEIKIPATSIALRAGITERNQLYNDAAGHGHTSGG